MYIISNVRDQIGAVDCAVACDVNVQYTNLMFDNAAHIGATSTPTNPLHGPHSQRQILGESKQNKFVGDQHSKGGVRQQREKTAPCYSHAKALSAPLLCILVKAVVKV